MLERVDNGWLEVTDFGAIEVDIVRPDDAVLVYPHLHICLAQLLLVVIVGVLLMIGGGN